jgi:MGT family glycosyltransferase
MTETLHAEAAPRRAHVLFAAHPTVGHTGALRAIGTELRARGHATSFALVQARVPFESRWPEPVRAAAALPRSIASEGATLCPLTPSPLALWHAARLPRATGQGELEIALTLFTSGLAQQAREIAAHARRTEAAVIVGDYLMPAALLGARLAQRPFAALYHSALPFPADGAPPFGTMLPESARGAAVWHEAEARLARMSAAFDRRVAQAARALGIPAPESDLLRQPISPDLNLLATTPALEPGLRPLAGPVVMTGPCLPPRSALDDAGRAALDALPRGVRIVYVSLGTVFNDQPGVYRALVAGAVASGAHVVVSAGASFDALAPLRGSGVQIFRRVPQVPLLERVDAVITHGGNNTVQECLAAGRPMVVLPFGGDQQANALRVERLGTGLRLRAESLESESVKVALERVMADDVVARARTLAESLHGYHGAAAAADAVLALAG